MLPDFAKIVLNQILSFKGENTNSNELGEILSPDTDDEESRKKSFFLDNFYTKLQDKLSEDTVTYSDIYDLSDILGKHVSSLLNMGGIFVHEFFEGLIDQSADEIELGIVRWNCHVELGVKTGGLVEFLGSVYSRME